MSSPASFPIIANIASLDSTLCEYGDDSETDQAFGRPVFAGDFAAVRMAGDLLCWGDGQRRGAACSLGNEYETRRSRPNQPVAIRGATAAPQ
ncbi:MAG: hypothetical protein ACI8TX_000048 [Hyphomicrobiaceae bacterium]|jgi:hypothetical protein